MIKKIAIIGAECSGKSTLTKRLAIQNQGIAVFEYLRHYCSLYGIPSSLNQQIFIAKKQIELENIAVFNSLKLSLKGQYRQIFCDTSPLLTYIYTLYYFKIDSEFLKELAIKHQKTYQKTFLLRPLAWIADGQRDSPKVQRIIYNMLLDYLNKFKIKFDFY